jgi:hypothetical protein
MREALLARIFGMHRVLLDADPCAAKLVAARPTRGTSATTLHRALR